jgi:hypothetical protein
MKKIRRWTKNFLIKFIKLFSLEKEIHYSLSSDIQRYANQSLENGFLYEIGWTNSFNKKMPVDKNDNPLPWLSYPMIHFLEHYLDKNMTIFEFGSGNSTLFFAERVKRVVSIEHDKKWYDRALSLMPKNVEMIFQELEYGGDYCKTLKKLNETFDIIFVDGRDRVNCVKESAFSLNTGGIIILDDSGRERYKEAFDFLKETGFNHFSIEGIPPRFFSFHKTTIFFKGDVLWK